MLLTRYGNLRQFSLPEASFSTLREHLTQRELITGEAIFCHGHMRILELHALSRTGQVGRSLGSLDGWHLICELGAGSLWGYLSPVAQIFVTYSLTSGHWGRWRDTGTMLIFPFHLSPCCKEEMLGVFSLCGCELRQHQRGQTVGWPDPRAAPRSDRRWISSLFFAYPLGLRKYDPLDFLLGERGKR